MGRIQTENGLTKNLSSINIPFSTLNDNIWYPVTTKNELEIYIENIKDRNFEFDVEVFNNYFSALKLVNDLS